MKIDLPEEIVNKKLLVFPLSLRIKVFLFPMIFLISLFNVPSKDSMMFSFIFIFLMISIYLAIFICKYSILFSNVGFSRSCFLKKETQWDEIIEIINITDAQGIITLNLRDWKKNKIGIQLPNKTGKVIIEKISEQLECNFQAPTK